MRKEILLGMILIMTTPNFASADEPNVEIAKKWWPELTNVITPVGWRDHFHRFNLVYDGTIIARPPEKPPQPQGDFATPLAGVQLRFSPSSDGKLPPAPPAEYTHTKPDGSRVGDQGWTDAATPVLWTRFAPQEGPMAGLELRELTFAHMSGGGESQSGLEPMYCWVRLEVSARGKSITADDCGFLVRINSPHIKFDMIESNNFRVKSEESGYPRKLRSESGPHGEMLLVEDDDKIRLAVLPGAKQAHFNPPPEGRHDNSLFLRMPAIVGAHVDLLVPMLRQERADFQKEMSLGWDGALAEANHFWSYRPATAATIHTPEPLINFDIEQNLRLARMISLTIPATKQKTLLSGSMVYSMLWITPTSMTSHMFLDPLGWHSEVDKYLEIHRQEQGTVKAPGPAFPKHPGYFGVPEAVDSGNQWLTDNGAVMYTVSRHAMLTDDQAFIDKWTEPLIKGYEFIRDSRRLPRGAPQVEGVMPSASASDISKPIQSFWSDAWCYKGLASTARLFKRINHPRADELQHEADNYRDAIVKAFRAKAARMPKWKDSAGNERTLVPMTISSEDTDGYSAQHPFYLDTGPMFGVWADILPADDPLMRDSVDFFRDGPHTRGEMRSERFDWKNSALLVHEMSNAEPCYSWNVFHTHQLGQRERYLEAMYSLFCGALSRNTAISCETRGGITENCFSIPTAVDLARLAVIDDEVDLGTLHLLRLTPLAWVSANEETRFENMPTEFGPVTLKWKLIDGGKTLQVSYTQTFRHQPQAIVLHIPPIATLEKCTINGKEHPARPGGRISL
jgi:hypothetical protein